MIITFPIYGQIQWGLKHWPTKETSPKDLKVLKAQNLCGAQVASPIGKHNDSNSSARVLVQQPRDFRDAKHVLGWADNASTRHVHIDHHLLRVAAPKSAVQTTEGGIHPWVQLGSDASSQVRLALEMFPTYTTAQKLQPWHVKRLQCTAWGPCQVRQRQNFKKWLWAKQPSSSSVDLRFFGTLLQVGAISPMKSFTIPQAWVCIFWRRWDRCMYQKTSDYELLNSFDFFGYRPPILTTAKFESS